MRTTTSAPSAGTPQPGDMVQSAHHSVAASQDAVQEYPVFIGSFKSACSSSQQALLHWPHWASFSPASAS